MIILLLILFVSAILGGMLNFLIPEEKEGSFRLSLVFAGAYLFAITIIHLLPEIFSKGEDGFNLGIFMLVGYFFQQVLENFTSGIEHGHLHRKDLAHHHSGLGVFSVLLALSVHAFLEGGLLAHPSAMDSNHISNSLLAGIVLHKIPAAFALMSIVTCKTRKKHLIILLLVLFASASPLGLVISNYSMKNQLVSVENGQILLALVCGSFLHISTTIVFESSQKHRFDLARFGVAIAGAIVAVFSEFI